MTEVPQSLHRFHRMAAIIFALDRLQSFEEERPDPINFFLSLAGSKPALVGGREPHGVCENDNLLHYSPYLQYDKALAEGVPIATGVIEGTCRHLVEDRMNLTAGRAALSVIFVSRKREF